METARLGTVVRHIRKLAVAPGTRALTDAQLLERFAVHQAEDAFAALMQRHGQLVWSVCRHVLRHDQDAEDAFQATFLVLARNAAFIRKQEALASWLHGTAYRIALRARRDALIRRTHESRGKTMPRELPFPETVLREALAVLDEEVQQLSPRQRAAFVLCSLEGKSLAEAAQQLGWKQGTVSGTLARARRRLGQRLTRRGVTLSAALSAVVLGRQAASAALPAGLAHSTTQAALLFAAGKSAAAALASPAAAALVEGVTRTMSLTKLKVATLVLLAAGVAGAGLLTHQALAAKESAQPPVAAPQASAEDTKPAPPEAPPAASRQEAEQALEVTGQVLDADGKPCAGAKLSLWTNAVKKPADMPVLAVTDADGRFRLTVARADRERDAKIVARARDHGPDWVEVAKLDKGTGVTLQLAKDDVPINGRVIDLEGQPVAGATIEVGRLEQSDMNRWMELAKKGISNHQDRELASVALDGPITVTTGKDGRFRLTGFGRDRTVLLRLRGDNIEHCAFWVVTRDEPLAGLRAGPYGTYSATFTHHALPSKPIVGTVRDRATGKPLAGITVASSMYNWRFATTDEKGQYRIVGAAKHDQYSVSAGSAPYLNCTKMDIADTPGLEPLRVDFDLDRGVAITGRLTDKTTGKPVRGYLGFIPLADNPNIKNFSELGKLHVIASDEAHAKADGSFTVTAIPGPGVLTARADDEDQFLPAEVEGIKLAQNIILDGYHAVIPVSPSESDPKSTHIDVALVPGRTLTGTLVGPDGQPLAGARAAGLGAVPKFFDPSEGKLATPSFTVSGLSLKKSRTVLFIHPEKKLARLLAIRPDELGPLTVRLDAPGTLAGRLVDAEGKPLAGVKVSAQLSFKPEDTKDLPADIQFNGQFWSKLITGEATTDKDGKFRVEGLVPGLKYLLNVKKEMEILTDYTRENLTVESGKANDLGELKAKSPAKEAKEKP
jgi:RNA polymerase sigma factor (sigma-70 family)